MVYSMINPGQMMFTANNTQKIQELYSVKPVLFNSYIYESVEELFSMM